MCFILPKQAYSLVKKAECSVQREMAPGRPWSTCQYLKETFESWRGTLAKDMQ